MSLKLKEMDFDSMDHLPRLHIAMPFAVLQLAEQLQPTQVLQLNASSLPGMYCFRGVWFVCFCQG